MKEFGKKIADVQARMLLSVIYFLMAPLALFMKKKIKQHNWDSWDLNSDSIEDLKRQY